MKKLLIIGVISLLAGVPFFYLAGAVPYITRTEISDSVNPVEDGTIGRTSWQSYPFGSLHYISVKPYMIYLQPWDFLSVYTVGSLTYTIVSDETSYDVLEYTNSPFLNYKNEGSSAIVIAVYVATDFQQTVTTTVVHKQSQTPNLICLSVGAFLTVQGIVLIITSRNKNKLLVKQPIEN
ncbi:MAG: hypothetical protein NWE84_01865 [Candidatus Bathyarchaeota archaeon]|nr:hypothetical protein [Candidatus Bathyarchaeota archaeon]